MFNSSSEGNLHKGYVEANDPSSLNSEFLFDDFSCASECVYLCVHIFLPIHIV